MKPNRYDAYSAPLRDKYTCARVARYTPTRFVSSFERGYSRRGTQRQRLWTMQRKRVMKRLDKKKRKKKRGGQTVSLLDQLVYADVPRFLFLLTSPPLSAALSDLRARGRASPPEDACGPPLFASGIRIRPRSCPNLVPPLDGTIEVGEMPGNVLFLPAYACS